MPPLRLLRIVTFAAWFLVLAVPAARAALPQGFYDALVFRGLDHPVGMAFLRDGRLLVVERESGVVQMVVHGSPTVAVPILTVEGLRLDLFEQGLLGVAVDPGWPARPYVYVYYDAADSTMRIARYRASGALDDPGSANLTLDPASRYDVIRDVPDASESHNGGTLRFGPDGMLYVALADDWDRCAAQDTVSLRGVMLRLDVSTLPDGPGGPPQKPMLAPPDNPWATHPDPNARLVWATGFRNPFRFHIDPADGALFVADVGSGSYEEISRIAAPGLNLGWPFYEANRVNASACTPAPGTVFTPPIHAHDRRMTSLAAIISAGVYRGAPCASCNFPPEYEGDYFFADYYQGFIRRLERNGSTWNLAAPVAGQPSAEDWGQGYIEVTDFLTGPDGAMWYCRTSFNGTAQSGEIRRILYFAPTQASVDGTQPSIWFSPPVPSPSRGRVRFSFTLERPGRADLAVYDVTGRRVSRVLESVDLAAGSHGASWDARGAVAAASGVYFARLHVDGVTLERRFAIVR
jgi:glucose/arabinose dehydrogenase